MKLYKRIFNNWEKEQTQILHQYGFDVEEGCDVFKIYDKNVYFELRDLLKKWDSSETLGIDFTKKEILSAQYCIINKWQPFGYPMPDDDAGYLHLTYDKDKMCDKCWLDKIQKSDFRVRKVPKYPMWSLEWVYDELFVRKDLYEKIFKPLGIECRSLRKYKDDSVIDSYVQLVIPVIEEPLDLYSYQSQKCSVCGTVKYDVEVQGYFPLQEHPLPYIYKSKEFFGDGYASIRRIFVSGKLRDLMIENGLIKVNDLVPCATPEEVIIKNQGRKEWE